MIPIYDEIILYRVLHFYNEGMTIRDISSFVGILEEDIEDILDSVLPYI